MKSPQTVLPNSLSLSKDNTSNPASSETFKGSVERILFSNAANGYAVCSMVAEHLNQQITICGTLPSVQPGHRITVTGSWTHHAKFGTQFVVQSYTVLPPSTSAGIEKYLASGLIKGIGPVYAKRLVALFGSTVLEIIDKQPERLHSVPGIGPKRVAQIIDAWQDQKEIAHIMLFLQEKGISTTHAIKIYKTYKQRAVELIIENPYRLAEDIWGIGFATADAIAQQLNIAPDSVKRCRAGILHTLHTATQQGHVYMELEALKTATKALLKLETDDQSTNIKTALHDLYAQDKIKLLTHQEKHFIALSIYYATEKGIAQRIVEIKQTRSAFSVNSTQLYTKLRTQNSIDLNEDQQRGIMNCFEHKVTIITGGPGTGKTTLIKSLLGLLEQEHIRYKLAAPTGRAAKRMTQSTNRPATTLHRLLEFDPVSMQFTRTLENTLECDFVIIDEASMIDIFLAHSLLKAVANTTHILFIGDIDQLPSVGAGNVLGDMIASNAIPTIRLSYIFRQAQDSLIVTNAHRINNGEFFITEQENSRRDFFFIKEEDPLALPHHLRTIFSTILTRAKISQDNATVLIPMNRGPAGTHILNGALQKLINTQPHAAQIVYGAYTFKEHDRVMQIRNNYDKLVFNGDIGTIITIDTQEQMLQVQFDTGIVTYETSELDELMLAYAISIHKSQGSEYEAAIIPIFMQHYTLLQRKLLYTAITRAKKLCIIIGQPKALWLAIKNAHTLQRLTFLQHFLTSDLAAR